jgi:hypothetical protein
MGVSSKHLIQEVLIVRIKRIFGYWLPLALVTFGVCFFTYIGIQQNYRMDANDPQIEMAQNAARDLENNVPPDAVLPTRHVELSSDLAPFVIVFNGSGEIITSSATLDGQTPTLPNGILAASDATGENRVTWQPRAGVRLATVIKPYRSASSSGYVLVGRSLHEVEARIDNLTTMFFITLVCALVGSLLLIILVEIFLLHPKEN